MEHVLSNETGGLLRDGTARPWMSCVGKHSNCAWLVPMHPPYASRATMAKLAILARERAGNIRTAPGLFEANSLYVSKNIGQTRLSFLKKTE